MQIISIINQNKDLFFLFSCLYNYLFFYFIYKKKSLPKNFFSFESDALIVILIIMLIYISFIADEIMVTKTSYYFLIFILLSLTFLGITFFIDNSLKYRNAIFNKRINSSYIVFPETKNIIELLDKYIKNSLNENLYNEDKLDDLYNSLFQFPNYLLRYSLDMLNSEKDKSINISFSIVFLFIGAFLGNLIRMDELDYNNSAYFFISLLALGVILSFMHWVLYFLLYQFDFETETETIKKINLIHKYLNYIEEYSVREKFSVSEKISNY